MVYSPYANTGKQRLTRNKTARLPQSRDKLGKMPTLKDMGLGHAPLGNGLGLGHGQLKRSNRSQSGTRAQGRRRSR